MNLSFLTSHFKEKRNKKTETIRHVFANARAGNKHEHYNHAMNKIQTSKYSIFTFLPFNLWEQFQRLANSYFLVLIILQFIPEISSLEPITTVIPLVIVLGITGAKDGLDDYNRHKSDRLVNNRELEFLDPQIAQLRHEKWMHIRTGDIIKIQQDKQITADVILLSTSDTHNLAYIETAELDGETNLKLRTALQCTGELMHIVDFDGNQVLRLAAFNAKVECEAPNNRLEKFAGTLIWKRDGIDREPMRFSITNDNVLLRGTTLRNVSWAFGLVVYAGPDTKLMQNTGRTYFKRTSIDNFLNKLVLYIGITLVLLALISSVGHILFESMWGKYFQIYLYWAEAVASVELKPEFVSGCLIFWSYIILLNTLVPISLYVSVEIIRLGQSFFINWDRQMYYSPKDTPAQARTTTLNEELGQVQYIFSDKTGTLTQNIMEFKMASIGGVCYGLKSDEEIFCDLKTFNPKYYVKNFDFADNHLLKDIINRKKCVIEFFTLLALNHTVMPDVTENGDMGYQAQSPDEGALVKAAKAFGFVFKSRTPNSITLYEVNNDQDATYELLQILDFDNVRKRMSVAVRRINENESSNIVMYTKGADTMIMERLREPIGNDQELLNLTKNHLDEFSAEGLRTLCLAYKEISEEEWFSWSQMHHEAATAIIDRDEKLLQVYEVIESDLVLLGATAVEDKLQIGVPETIANLAKAGINFWVLTGDKQETAINIGYSCNLLTDEMLDVFVLDGVEKFTVMEELRIDIGVLSRKCTPGDYGLVVTGSALSHALTSELEDLFIELSLKCKAVICCRVTPLQKAQIVELVKRSQSAVTLAIGDGANDVSMIKEAQIGVGISGEEGTQAVLASDFSIAQFKYLERLLLVHGRWSYYRMCKFLDYFFYKNFAFTLIHFWFGFVCGFSASNSYDQWMITMYNVFYTSFPPLCIGLLDKDVNDKFCILNPNLYRLGQQNKLFNLRIFFYSVLRGIITSMILFFIPFGVFFETVGSSETYFDAGKTVGQQGFAFVVASCLVLIVNVQVALDTSYWTVINHFFIWASVLFYFAANFSMFSNGWYTAFGTFTVKSFPFVGVGRFMICTPQFWSCIVLTLVIYVGPVLTFRVYKNITRPNDSEKLRVELNKERRKKKKCNREVSNRRGGSQRPGTQRPDSSYAFSHQKGFAELIMSGRMTSQRRKRKTSVIEQIVGSVPAAFTLRKPTVTFQNVPSRKEMTLSLRQPPNPTTPHPLNNWPNIENKTKVQNPEKVNGDDDQQVQQNLEKCQRFDSIVGMESSPSKHERLIE